MLNNDSQHDLRSSDKRYFPRWEVNNNVSLQLENDNNIYHGATEDMSCAGARIKVDKQDILPNDKLKVTIKLSEAVMVELKGQVAWVKPDSGNGEVGINFQNIPEKVQDLIVNHAFEVDRKKIVNNWFKGWK